MNIQEIKKQLDTTDIENILHSFGVDAVRHSGQALVFPTVCHNAIEDGGSDKLYFYNNSNLFTCYTECGTSFDIIELIQKIFSISYGQELSLFEAINVIENRLNKNFELNTEYTSDNSDEMHLSKFLLKEPKEEITIYNDVVLDVFSKTDISNILGEGISQLAIDKFEISYYLHHNMLVFPWRDVDGNLVALKGRAMDWTPDSHMAKYLPVTVENIIYKNRISSMVYGLYQNKYNLQGTRQAFIFEGEKSILKMEDAFEYNNSIAVGGQNIHPKQYKMLLDLGVTEIILCFDKDFEDTDYNKKEQVLTLLIKRAKQLTPFFEVFIMFDNMQLLPKKASPIDCGLDTFLALYNNKIHIY